MADCSQGSQCQHHTAGELELAAAALWDPSWLVIEEQLGQKLCLWMLGAFGEKGFTLGLTQACWLLASSSADAWVLLLLESSFPLLQLACTSIHVRTPYNKPQQDRISQNNSKENRQG